VIVSVDDDAKILEVGLLFGVQEMIEIIYFFSLLKFLYFRKLFY
jgi:hypothetical protein